MSRMKHVHVSLQTRAFCIDAAFHQHMSAVKQETTPSRRRQHRCEWTDGQ